MPRGCTPQYSVGGQLIKSKSIHACKNMKANYKMIRRTKCQINILCIQGENKTARGCDAILNLIESTIYLQDASLTHEIARSFIDS